MEHAYYWNKLANGHTCGHCQKAAPTATREQHLTYSRLLDDAEAALVGGKCGITRTHVVLYVSTPQGYAQAHYGPFGSTNPQVHFTLNMRPIDAIPTTFRKFHTLLPQFLVLVPELFAARQAILDAESDTQCPTE